MNTSEYILANYPLLDVAVISNVEMSKLLIGLISGVFK